eukprot:317058-Amphidinium_carterae.2
MALILQFAELLQRVGPHAMFSKGKSKAKAAAWCGCKFQVLVLLLATSVQCQCDTAAGSSDASHEPPCACAPELSRPIG